jgi:SAM-dependent methyltransferase
MSADLALPQAAPATRNPGEFATLEDNWAAAAGVIERACGVRSGLQVLEAGGGSQTNVGFLPAPEFTAVDISQEQLDRNPWAHHKLLADIETFTAYTTAYDVAVCSDVLEHLRRPEAALNCLVPALKPGGVLIVGGPVPTSFKGLVTKFTPHAVHVWAYRRLLGYPMAGQPGHPPFPTVLKFSMGPSPLTAWAHANGLEPLHVGRSHAAWVVGQLRKKSPLLSGLYLGVMAVLRLASLGTWRPDLTDMVLVFRKR